MKMKFKIFEKKIFSKPLTFFEWLYDEIWYCDLFIFVRKCGRFLKRLKTWLPVVWKQENWDYEYLYDLIELKLKEFLRAQQEDYLHEKKGIQRRIRHIKICLAYLDRYRNWTSYYDYPMDDIQHIPTDNGLAYQMIHTSSINEAKRRGAHTYEQFNYEMFWKRFMQWHREWWT